jgi:hypothetical protein
MYVLCHPFSIFDLMQRLQTDTYAHEDSRNSVYNRLTGTWLDCTIVGDITLMEVLYQDLELKVNFMKL